MTHEIPEEVTNSSVEHCISEYVRNVNHRNMLRDKWFHGLTLEQIAEKYHLSVTSTKDIIYGIGDKVLIRATALTMK